MKNLGLILFTLFAFSALNLSAQEISISEKLLCQPSPSCQPTPDCQSNPQCPPEKCCLTLNLAKSEEAVKETYTCNLQQKGQQANGERGETNNSLTKNSQKVKEIAFSPLFGIEEIYIY